MLDDFIVYMQEDVWFLGITKFSLYLINKPF